MAKQSYIACLLVVALLMSSPLQAAGTPPLEGPTKDKTTAWVEILPNKTNSDAKAEDIARKLLAKDIAEYKKMKSNYVIEAAFVNGPGIPVNSFIIAKLDGLDFCGLMGCMTYFLKQTDIQKNKWKMVYLSNFNSIITSEALLKRRKAFYTKGTNESRYRRYNTATEAYENFQ